MLGDENDKVSARSRAILRAYKSSPGPAGWKRRLGRTVVPAILELVEALPAFAKCGRESEVRNYLRLVDGYLVLSFRGMDNDFDLQECLKEKRKSDIGSALSCTEAVDLVKKSFSVLFAPDIDSVTCSPTIEIDSSSDTNKLTKYQENDACRFLYLREETIDAAKNTVHLLARALGTKRCAFVIDSCFADTFESCSRSCNDHILINEGFNQRLHWSGLCTFSGELLKGLSGSDHGRKASKLPKSTLHILSSLASSVLPVIVSNPLWTLPTVLGEHAVGSGSDARTLPKKTEKVRQLGLDRNEGLGTTPSITIMNSNAVLISSLMGFICQFTRALRSDNMRQHLPTILFPLLERASHIGNHSSVQRAAFASLWEISLAIGYEDISSLLASNCDYLVDVICLRLQKHGREQIPIERSLFGVIDVILRSILHNGGPTSNVENSDTPMAHVAMVGHMLKCLLNLFDRQSYMTNMTAFDTVSVFQSMNTFMAASIEVYTSNNDHAAGEMPQMEKDDWFQRLDFELNLGSAGHANDSDSNDGMFGELDNEKDNDPTDEAPTSNQVSPEDEVETDMLQEIVAINDILSKCCYLLCCADLRIQVICCDTILSGFRSLGKIGSFRKKLRGEPATNPMLPAIAEFWPSVIARLRSASSDLASVNRISRSDLSIRHVMATDQEQGPSKAGLEVLITKLILIISELCMSSDGFFVDRYENEVYPIIAKLMQDILPNRLVMGHEGHSSTSEQKHSLLLPILHFFQCTFESSCRHGLAGLIPSAGAMLFPLLAYRSPIGDAAVATVKAMLAVDCDALWRGLHTLSGRPFPVNPIFSNNKPTPKIFTAVIVSNSRQLTECCDLVLSEKAGELLDFVKGLREQPL